MQSAVAKVFYVLALVATMTGCKSLATFTSAPYADVNLTASVQKLSHHDFEVSSKTTFVHLKYTISTRSDVPVYFKVENISVSVNGTKNTGAYYDSIASIIPHWKRLINGENVIEVYAVFPGIIDVSAIHELKFINYGLSREAKNTGQSISYETHNTVVEKDAPPKSVAPRLSP